MAKPRIQFTPKTKAATVAAKTRKTDSQRRRVVRDIFDNFERVPDGAKAHGIGVGTYYAWKNKYFKNGKGLRRGNSRTQTTSQSKTGARQNLAFDRVTFDDHQMVETATTVNSKNDIASLVEENQFLWRKISRMMGDVVR